MRRFLLLLLLVFLLSCQALAFGQGTLTPTLPALVTVTPAQVSPSPTLAPLSTKSSPVTPPTPSASPVAPDVPVFTVRLHPDGGLYVGDQVSLEVIAPQEADLQDNQVQVQVGDHDLGSADFKPYGLVGRLQATLLWAWNTSDLQPGAYTLTFSVKPAGYSWSQTVMLNPQSQVLPPAPLAHWETVASECCRVHYITGTDAARNLAALLETADRQAAMSVEQMGVSLDQPIPVTILPRVLGHGGFTSNEVYVTYLGRDYAGSDFAQVLHHEIIHLLDGRLGGDLRPAILVEGLAVYLTGGHYKPEPLLPRAAALLDLGWYIPLTTLTDDFYTSQHEIGYIEAGALVKYMVATFGWSAYSNFYRDIHPQPNGQQSQAMDAALQAHFGISFHQLEQGFTAELRRQHINPDVFDDVRLTIAFYDTVRRYQLDLDPSAYFLTAWLPDGEQMRQRGIVADYIRHPQGPENHFLEELLVQADSALIDGRYPETEHILALVNANLDAIDMKVFQPYGVTLPVFDLFAVTNP